MIQMTYANFRLVGTKKIQEMLPMQLTADGVPFAVIHRPEDVIVIEDMHPGIIKRLRGLELMARKGMTPIKKVKAEDVKEPSGE